MGNLINLVDDAIIAIHTDETSHGGCETCDYGSEYINEIQFIFTNSITTIKAVKMYDYALTVDWVMKTFLGNIHYIETMTKNQFIDWITNEVKEQCPSGTLYGREIYGVTIESL